VVEAGQAQVPIGGGECDRASEHLLYHEEFYTVENDPGDVTEKKDHDNTDEHSGKVHFTASGLVCLGVGEFDSSENSRVEEDESCDRNNAGEDESAPVLVITNIIRIFPKLCHIICQHVFTSDIGGEGVIQLSLIYGNVNEFCFKELWDVEDDCKYNNRDDILSHPTGDAGGEDSISVVERVAHSCIPLQSYGHSETYRAADCDIIERVEQLWEYQGICLTLSVEWPGKYSNTSIVQDCKEYEGVVKEDKNHQQQVERVPHVRPCEDDDAERVPKDAK